jgi:hypothetical protein
MLPQVPTLYEECRALAKSAGAKRFKWGRVNDATAEACWAGGTCGAVQEYLIASKIGMIASLNFG